MGNSDKVVMAAGAVLWRRSRKHGVRIAVIHRPRYDDWSLPKGKAEPGEVPALTAVREVAEETGMVARLGRYVRRVDYRVQAGHKQVHYFAAATLGGSFSVNREVDRLDWLPIDKAQERLSHPRDRQIITDFTELPAHLATLVLVRHAKAGSRGSYQGPDSGRPLDGKGQQQARELADQLACFGPTAISAAPLVRCRQTMAPIADRSGLPVRDDPVFAESHHDSDPTAVHRRVLELIDDHRDIGVPAVCSQAGVIPDAVSILARHGGIALPTTTTPKSSFWVLSFDGTELRQADHYRSTPPFPP